MGSQLPKLGRIDFCCSKYDTVCGILIPLANSYKHYEYIFFNIGNRSPLFSSCKYAIKMNTTCLVNAGVFIVYLCVPHITLTQPTLTALSSPTTSYPRRQKLPSQPETAEDRAGARMGSTDLQHSAYAGSFPECPSQKASAQRK